MTKQPVFSIVVPVYKVEQYLHTCVTSLRRQTYSDIEILLIDDGSPDGCPAMCDAYAKEDKRIRVIHKPNGGLSDARNAGIEAAVGDYLFFVDSDDALFPTACEQFLPYAAEGCDILVGDGTSTGAYRNLCHRGFPGVCSGKDYLKKALTQKAMPMAAWLYVYKRAFLLEKGLRFKYGILHEDEEFTPRAFLEAERVVDTGINFYSYVIRANSITTGKDQRKNMSDLYTTCLELKERYDRLEDTALKHLLLDSLVNKYLSLFQACRAYRYGRAYIHKRFVRQNAYLRKTKYKAFLFSISPRLYWHVNASTKSGGR
ncbi:MAG: glycosyltransferase [Clostridia bacterium]|nr:glycosyltransferase [Clostridia bacterium]